MSKRTLTCDRCGTVYRRKAIEYLEWNPLRKYERNAKGELCAHVKCVCDKEKEERDSYNILYAHPGLKGQVCARRNRNPMMPLQRYCPDLLLVPLRETETHLYFRDQYWFKYRFRKRDGKVWGPALWVLPKEEMKIAEQLLLKLNPPKVLRRKTKS